MSARHRGKKPRRLDHRCDTCVQPCAPATPCSLCARGTCGKPVEGRVWKLCGLPPNHGEPCREKAER